jgi:hypothetical protein
LLDDVGFDGDAEVVGLAGEVGGEVEIFVGGGEGGVSEVTPEDGDEAELVGGGEGAGDFLDLAVGFGGAEIDGCADGDGTHVEGLFDLGEHDLVELVGIAQELVVVELDEEGDFVGVFAGAGAEDAEG